MDALHILMIKICSQAEGSYGCGMSALPSLSMAEAPGRWGPGCTHCSKSILVRLLVWSPEWCSVW